MTEMGELLMGAAMIAPLQTCTQICQKLGDTILNDSDENDGPPRPEMAPCLFVFLSRFTAQVSHLTGIFISMLKYYPS